MAPTDVSPAGIAAGAELHRIGFSDIEGWDRDRHGEAFAAFHAGCAAIGAGGSGTSLRDACLAAAALGRSVSDAAARAFFETHFVPHRVIAGGRDHGLFTGYFEPELEASRSPAPGFPVPVLGPPDNLVSLAGIRDRGRVPESHTHAMIEGGRLVAAPSRAEIAAGALGAGARPIAWLQDPIDAFFLHVQGSGRLRYRDGSTERVAYAGKNGHPYTSIGRLLVERGVMAREDVTMQSLRAWLTANRAAGEALMNENRSYIFFRRIEGGDPGFGPAGQLGVPLTPGRSLAVDLAHHAGNMPIWLETTVPGVAGGPPAAFRRLMIAQDTGSAIRGPIRGDIFFGSGDAAGEIAGRMQGEGRMIVLVPRCSVARC